MATAFKRRSPWWGDALLLLASVLVSLAVAEAVVRMLNGQPLLAFPLPDGIDEGRLEPEDVDAIPRSAGVDRAWFFTDPAPLPNRQPPPEGWQSLFMSLREKWLRNSSFQPSDTFKAWNARFAGDPCQHPFLNQAPGHLYLYDPADGKASPPYRFYPNVTLPDRLVTNQIGWRGAPIEFPRGPRTVRIVFVGSSTVVDGHFAPWSYPEYVGHWLKLWAQSKKLDVRFEVLNSARESMTSTDIANVVHGEILPLRPDLVVYYEGGNQFRVGSIVEDLPKGSAVRPPSTGASVLPDWLRTASRWSALLGRVQAAIGLGASDLDGREWPKPDYKVVWPPGLDEQDPDLSYPRLPVSLNEIQRDLDRIRADLGAIGSDFALSSFVWMVKDGMVVDPIRHRYILEQLNVTNYPFRYRDIERLAKFQNRVFAKYARTHGLLFVDVARQLPLDPDLFIDAYHTTYAGTRMRGWITFNQMLPLIEKRLADRWPRPMPDPQPPLPAFTPRRITLSCKAS